MASSTLNNGFDNRVPKFHISLSERYEEMPGFKVQSFPVEVRILRLPCPVTIKSTNHRNPPLSYPLPSLCIQRLHSRIDINTSCEVGRWTSISTSHTQRLDRSIHSPTAGQIIYWVRSMPQRYPNFPQLANSKDFPYNLPATKVARPTNTPPCERKYACVYIFRCLGARNVEG